MDLECRYDSRKSFYGKAKVTSEENENEIIYKLYSYGTYVAVVIYNTKTGVDTYQAFGKWSQTTTRHQYEFFKQHNLFDKKSINDIISNGIIYDFKEGNIYQKRSI